MPFKDMSASQEFNWLGDGVAEDLINGLTQISDLYVSPRTDSFGFRDSKQRVTAIGRALGVTNVLDGSVRVAGDKARISVELVNVADGFQLWSGQFDGALDDVFSFQDEITVKVVDALKIAMTESFRSQLKFLGSSNIEVHRLMQQSMLENPAERVRKLERIIQIEPDSIGPRRVLAGSLSALQTAEGVDPEDKLKIRQLLEDIFQADRNNLRSESWLESYQLLSMDWKWREALEILVRTIKTGDFQALDQGAGPNPNPVLSLIRMNLEGGNFKACRATLEYVSRFSPRASNALIWVHLAARDMEKTIKTALSTLASQPADAFVVSGLMTAYIKTGRIVEARDLLGRFNMLGTVHRAKLFEALIEIVGGDIQKGVMLADEFEKTAQGLPFFRGILKMHMGEIDDGFDRWFEAVEKKDDLVTWVNFMYAYAPDGIVDDPRFEEVRRAAGRDHAWKLELGEVTASLSADIGIEYEIDTSPQFPQWPGSQV